ncbi:ferrochelatase-2, chloroplastic [Trifolium repens]|nr:ferrochelatase-2, chloroplastic [Trifolium repens]
MNPAVSHFPLLPNLNCRRFSLSCSDIQNLNRVACHLDCNKSTSQASLCPGSTNGSIASRNLACWAFSSVDASTYNEIVLGSPSHTAEEKVGVLLLNLGGPETLDDVQPFLFNLFADPDIIRLPRLFRFLQRPLAKLISTLRAPKSKEGYASIGGGSPLRKITDDQALALKMALEAKGLTSNVYVGMRYWFPFTEEAVQQFSISTTGSSISVLEQTFREDDYLSRLPISIINSWYQREGYLKSMADLIEKELQSFSEPMEAMIFFSANGVPVSYVENAGDPYRDQMEECIFLIMQELKARGISNKHTLAYQSRVGPKGVKSLLAVPVSFVSEHIETLEEIDMEYRELALESGIKNWARVPALGLTPSFITDLADAVIEALPSAAAIYAPANTSEDMENDPGQEWTFVQAKSEILHKVCDIVKKQLAVPDDSNATGESKFTNTCEDILEVSGKNG